MKKWDDKRDYGYILIDFNVIKMKSSEHISDFIKRLNKLYNNPRAKIKPRQAAPRVVFSGAFDL